MSPPDLTMLDRPDILSRLFHPRPEIGSAPAPNATSLMIPVEKKIAVGADFYPAGENAPTLVFFHGNGEIVADYQDLAPLYTMQGINFLPVDYRGYGRSGGQPTLSGMIRDSHKILDFALAWLSEKRFTGPIFVMGRSLGSASALELAARRQNDLSGLILESAFAYGVPLLNLLGVLIENEQLVEEHIFQHPKKIKNFQKPLLIIHAEFDHIIPISDGRALFDASGSEHKSFIEIANADHNDIFFRGRSRYMSAISALCLGATPT
jgi:alpha-beta hydrolase superfamily lysophospholipase